MPDAPPACVLWPRLLALFAATLGVRGAVLLATHAQVADGDWALYARVAHNILSGCGVSLSPPGAPCVPHFGGNGLPGYPAFIAAIWTLAAPTKSSVLWAQMLAGALAVPRLAFAVSCLAGRRAGLACGLMAALSPLQAGMVRYGLAESLTMATATCLFAECALSLAQRRFRLLPIAACTAAGLFLRLDFVAFLPPIASVGLAIHRPAAAVRRFGLLAALIALPLGLWTLRNAAAGVPIQPPARAWMLPDGTIGPLGYLNWLKQWVTNADQRAGAMFFAGDHYDMIHLLPSAFRSPDQTARAEILLRQLRTRPGQPFPPTIDQAFAALATDQAHTRTLTDTATLRAAQAWGFWQSWADPLPPEHTPAGPSALINTITRLYRTLLGAAFIATVLTTSRHPLIRAAASLVAAKTLIGVIGLFLEPRYTMTAVPALELAVTLALSRRSNL